MLQDIFKAILVTSFIGTALTLVLTLIKPVTKNGLQAVGTITCGLLFWL